MKPWIKKMIKTTELAYLTVSDRETSSIIPFPYTYDKGHLLGSLGILQADLISTIEEYPRQHLLITLDDKEVGMYGKIFLDKSDLDEGWKQYNSSDEFIRKEKVRNQIERVPHYSKRVVLDFIPIRIDVDDAGEHRSYEMEIL